MQMSQIIRKVGGNDVKLFGRDNFLIFMLAFAAVIAVALRFGIPALTTALDEQNILNETTFIASLTELYPMIVAYMVIFTGGTVFAGTIFGFMLLDERDDNTLIAMLVTPVSLRQYVQYRVIMPTILAFVTTLLMVYFVGIALLPWWQMILVAAAASLAAPIILLFFAAFAADKVQGFAYSKFVSLAGWIIAGGWFVPEPFQWLLGLFPPFWVSKAYWMALEGHNLWGLVLVIGVIAQVGALYWLVQRFIKVAYS